jgi:hypothetical protein
MVLHLKVWESRSLPGLHDRSNRKSSTNLKYKTPPSQPGRGRLAVWKWGNWREAATVLDHESQALKASPETGLASRANSAANQAINRLPRSRRIRFVAPGARRAVNRAGPLTPRTGDGPLLTSDVWGLPHLAPGCTLNNLAWGAWGTRRGPGFPPCYPVRLWPARTLRGSLHHHTIGS